MGVNDDILNALTRHQIGLLRVSNATARKVLAALKRSEARIVQRLLTEGETGLSRTRQERMLREIRRIIDGAYEDATGQLIIDIEALAEYEAEYQDDMFRRLVPVRIDTVVPPPQRLIAAVNARPFQGRLLREVYSDLSAVAFRRVRNAIRAGFIEGRSVSQIASELRGTAAQGYRDGVLAQNRRDVETVVRTAVNHTANVAREEFYKGNPDLLRGVRWNAVLDGRTTMVCMSRDGKIYKVGKGPRPPAHYNCRSSMSPVLKSWRSLGIDGDGLERSAKRGLDGKEPVDITYDAWLRKQPREFQDETLGPTRAKLFREGLTVDRFVDRAGNEYSLDELRKRERDAWEKTAA